MKIALIDIQSNNATGIRSLSSRLQQDNHTVKMIFENSNTHRMICNPNYIYRYKQSVLDNIVEFCRDVDLVGFSLMTNFFDRVSQLTAEIKKNLKVPVVWGGIHPTICPEECIDYADIVCIGEGDTSILELTQKMEKGENYFDTNGFAFKKNGEMIINSAAPLINADEIPAPDYDLKNHWFISEGGLVKLNEKNYYDFIGTQLSYSASRGCPYKCSYCANNVFHKLHPKGFLRMRRLQDVVDELGGLTEKYPGIKSIFFNDDSFTSHRVEDLNEFAMTYKNKVNLPFSCITTPNCGGKKLEILFSAGLRSVCFGLQSANIKTLEKYNRPIKNQKIKEVAKDLVKYGSEIKINYDVILDSPFETDLEKLYTIRFLLDLPIKYSLWFFSFTFYPGTELTLRGLKEGIIEKCSYRKCEQGPKLSIVNLLFYLAHLAGQGKMPRWIVSLLSTKYVFAIINRKVINIFLSYIGQYRNKKRYFNVKAENYN